MYLTPHAVAIVVNRAFGEELVPLARRMHVWIIDSHVNRLALDKVLNQATVDSLESGATLFSDDGTQSPDVIALRMLADVELHHGSDAHDPPLSHLEVYGTPLTPELSQTLGDLGFDQFEHGAGYFLAVRSVAA